MQKQVHSEFGVQIYTIPTIIAYIRQDVNR